MADAVHPVHGEVHRHPAPTGFIRKYVFSTDHKVIGIQYWCLALFAVFVGMALSLLMRLQLGWPGQEWGFLKTLFPNAAPNGTVSGELYLSMLTMHGTIHGLLSCSHPRRRADSATIFSDSNRR